MENDPKADRTYSTTKYRVVAASEIRKARKVEEGFKHREDKEMSPHTRELAQKD